MLVVRDYGKALVWYTRTLGFTRLEHTHQPEHDQRWMLVAAPELPCCWPAPRRRSKRLIGNQAGGRVVLFLHTDDFWRDYDAMRANGVRFVRGPTQAAYGTVGVVADL